jgi:hypothetical protein
MTLPVNIVLPPLAIFTYSFGVVDAPGRLYSVENLDDVDIENRLVVPALVETIESFEYGVVEPIPTFPVCMTVSPLDPATVNPPANVDVAVVEVAT